MKIVRRELQIDGIYTSTFVTYSNQ